MIEQSYIFSTFDFLTHPLKCGSQKIKKKKNPKEYIFVLVLGSETIFNSFKFLYKRTRSNKGKSLLLLESHVTQLNYAGKYVFCLVKSSSHSIDVLKEFDASSMMKFHHSFSLSQCDVHFQL
jgi:hypothetical protein